MTAPKTYVPTFTTATRRRFIFANGYGASVISDGYGRDEGLFELAVLDEAGRLTYETPITDDVLGWLDEDDVEATLAEIAALPAVTA